MLELASQALSTFSDIISTWFNIPIENLGEASRDMLELASQALSTFNDIIFNLV